MQTRHLLCGIVTENVKLLRCGIWCPWLTISIKVLCVCRRLGSAGEPAVHFLSRLLSFDPSRRCSAEEALAHEYLTAVEAQASGNFEGGCSTQGSHLTLYVLVLCWRLKVESQLRLDINSRGRPSGIVVLYNSNHMQQCYGARGGARCVLDIARCSHLHESQVCL